MPIKVDIFSGFLGAGKTMLIKKLLEDGVYGKNVAIIENEFGEVAIDGAYLRQTGIAVKEIKSGCICCSVTGDFKEALEKLLKDYPLEHLIIEPSGVAALSEVLGAFKEKQFEKRLQINHIITVVDPTHFDTYIANFGFFYKNQIIHAKTVVLSRTQMLDSMKCASVVSEIRKLNTSCQIVTTPWDKLRSRYFLEMDKESYVQVHEEVNRQTHKEVKREIHKEVNKEVYKEEHKEENKEVYKGIAYGDQVSALKAKMVKEMNGSKRGKISSLFKPKKAEEVFESLGIEKLKPFKREKIETLLKELKKTEKYGEILRAKGILQLEEGKWVEWDYVYGEYEIRETKAYTFGALCIIGRALQKEALRKLF